MAVWGPDYTTGVTISGQTNHFDYAAEFKNAALSSLPESWSATEVGFDHPAFNGRLGFRPDLAWNFGVSVGEGTDSSTGQGPGNGRAITVGQDASYAAGHWELWTEAIESRFEVPGLGNLEAFSYYVEAKYKFTPQLFGALRWNQQIFLALRPRGLSERRAPPRRRRHLSVHLAPTSEATVFISGRWVPAWRRQHGGHSDHRPILM